MSNKVLAWISSRRWFLGFTGVFAVLAAYVFWGTWSPDAAPVMPDDTVYHPLAFGDQFAAWFRGWLRNGVFVPEIVFWEGIAVSKYWMQELKYVSALYFSALGLAYFLRGRGLSPLASYGAGLLLGFCGYWSTLFSAGHGTFFVLVSAMVPALAFLDHAMTRGKLCHWILFGAAVGWGCCYQPDIFLLFMVLIVAYGLYACVRERKFPWKGGLVALVAFAAVGAPGVRSAFTESLTGRDKQIEESKGTSLAGGKGKVAEDASDEEKKKADDEARWVFVTNWSLPPEETLEFFIPRLNGDTSCPMTLQLARAAGKDTKPYTGALGRPLNAKQGNYRQHSLYVGWVTCLLALIGVVFALLRTARAPTSSGNGEATFLDQSAREGTRSTGRDVLFFAAAALVFWVFSMGRFCEPAYRIVYALPFGDYLRGPVKWHHVTELCLCVLAGLGIEALLRLVSEKVNPKAALAIVGVVVFVGAADLARIDKLFCAPIDLTLVRGRNAAADEVVRRGKGGVCDLIEGANGLINWSFRAHGAAMTRGLNEADTRFVLVGTDQANRNPQIANWLRQKTTPVGTYLLSRDGFRAAPPTASNVALYQVNGVPPPPEPARPPVNGLVVALGILSLLGTFAALGCLVRIGFGESQSCC